MNQIKRCEHWTYPSRCKITGTTCGMRYHEYITCMLRKGRYKRQKDGEV